MSKRKKDPSTIGLSAPELEGQGTTNMELDGKRKSSARKKKKNM